MNAKTKLPNASCPLGKWGTVTVPFDRELPDVMEINDEQ
jgi:hypothetical protein